MLRKMKTQFSQMFIYKYTREMIRGLAGTTLNLEAEFVRTDLLAETMNGTVSVFFLPFGIGCLDWKEKYLVLSASLKQNHMHIKDFHVLVRGERFVKQVL